MGWGPEVEGGNLNKLRDYGDPPWSNCKDRPSFRKNLRVTKTVSIPCFRRPSLNG